MKTNNIRDKFGTASFFDFDGCSYSLYRDMDSPDKLKFAFKSICHKQIMDNGGVEMLDALYKENLLPDSEALEGFDITLAIDTSGMEKTSSKFYKFLYL